jgi:hypothetical protein
VGGKDGKPEDVRQQGVRVLKRAAELVGSNAMLAERLGVAPHALSEWLALIGDPPDAVIHAATDVILDYWDRNGKKPR